MARRRISGRRRDLDPTNAMPDRRGLIDCPHLDYLVPLARPVGIVAMNMM
jgi:hypothetical protein